LAPILQEMTESLLDAILKFLSSMTFEEAFTEFEVMKMKDFEEDETKDDINEVKVAYFLINIAATDLVRLLLKSGVNAVNLFSSK
jgi:hypothetical protein